MLEILYKTPTLTIIRAYHEPRFVCFSFLGCASSGYRFFLTQLLAYCPLSFPTSPPWSSMYRCLSLLDERIGTSFLSIFLFFEFVSRYFGFGLLPHHSRRQACLSGRGARVAKHYIHGKTSERVRLAANHSQWSRMRRPEETEPGRSQSH